MTQFHDVTSTGGDRIGHIEIIKDTSLTLRERIGLIVVAHETNDAEIRHYALDALKRADASERPICIA